MYYTYMDSPVGPLMIAGDDEGLRNISFSTGKKPAMFEPDWVESKSFLDDTVYQIQEYFAGRLKTFDLKLAPRGTVFQRKVLNALRDIPYGSTRSYGDIARVIGNPKASRAVGAANGRNPLSIVIPCHRVIGQSGKLVGFGGGLKTKEWLLSLEKKHLYRKR